MALAVGAASLGAVLAPSYGSVSVGMIVAGSGSLTGAYAPGPASPTPVLYMYDPLNNVLAPGTISPTYTVKSLSLTQTDFQNGTTYTINSQPENVGNASITSVSVDAVCNDGGSSGICAAYNLKLAVGGTTLYNGALVNGNIPPMPLPTTDVGQLINSGPSYAEPLDTVTPSPWQIAQFENPAITAFAGGAGFTYTLSPVGATSWPSTYSGNVTISIIMTVTA